MNANVCTFRETSSTRRRGDLTRPQGEFHRPQAYLTRPEGRISLKETTFVMVDKSGFFRGDPSGARTRDTLLKRQVLCQLS